jgi:spore coat polysaccharide biosynthesis protein SpsF
MRLLGVVQARMSSQRLPGKVLLELGDTTVLGRVVRAVTESGAVDELVVATSTDPSDDAVAGEAARLGVSFHRGPLDDVLARFLGALQAHPADAVVRFTADCPLLDPEIIALGAAAYRALPGLDYLSTSLHRCLPRGLDVEIASAVALRVAGGAAQSFHRTHVTSYLYSNPDLFRVLGIGFAPDVSFLRATLDTREDWALVQAVVSHFGSDPVPLSRLSEWLIANPAVRALNASVKQKALADG